MPAVPSGLRGPQCLLLCPHLFQQSYPIHGPEQRAVASSPHSCLRSPPPRAPCGAVLWVPSPLLRPQAPSCGTPSSPKHVAAPPAFELMLKVTDNPSAPPMWSAARRGATQP